MVGEDGQSSVVTGHFHQGYREWFDPWMDVPNTILGRVTCKYLKPQPGRGGGAAVAIKQQLYGFQVIRSILRFLPHGGNCWVFKYSK